MTSVTLAPNQSLLPLTATTQAGHLTIGGCDLVDLVQQYGSPLYVLDEESVRQACRQYRQAFQTYYPGQSQVLYASKAWSCLAICALVAAEGLGIDIVSGGELYTALEAGVSPQLLYLHGNNKSRAELEYAIAMGVTIVVDNFLELELLQQLPPARIMLRLTPGIECHTHEYIQTGHLDSKFGFDPNQIETALEMVAHSQLNCVGLHAHIGSQIFELQPHRDLGSVMIKWLAIAQAKFGLTFTELNIGGGLGIRYIESDDPPSIDAWVRAVTEGVSDACAKANLPLPKLLCEPGRSLIGSACVTAYSVGSTKTVPGIRTYITVDGGMSDNPRPITYQSSYRALLANRMDEPATELVTIAGKHCESGDVLIRDFPLAAAQPGDILVVPATGAYNYSMASNYNRLPKIAAVLVNQGEANLILKRETYQDLLRQDYLPQRLQTPVLS
ncbi:MAG: diaminopimelate decarboxylase [Pseudanabaenaceae cyanobacterium bins.68]|nr:diaminopimelate decarboxylase [Pseudanabaenaceae cyanobacterium bins.68]